MLLRDVELRLGRMRDATSIALLSRTAIEAGLPAWTWTPSRVARSIRQAETATVVACRGERLVGFAIMEFGEETGHLNLLAVNQDCRRSGLGRRLLKWLEASALTAGIGRIHVEVRERNGGARAFYAALGFFETELVPRYYCACETAVRMVRDLRVSAV